MRKSILCCFGLFVLIIQGYGQQDAIASQYHLNPAMINPAYSGLYNSFMISANSRLQWIGVDGNPKSNFLTATTSIISRI